MRKDISWVSGAKNHELQANFSRTIEVRPTYDQTHRKVGNKSYELSNHLGNVLEVITDRKIGYDTDGNGSMDVYTADVISYSDYYPFGMLMPSRHETGEYRYGFQGQEMDDEIKGKGNSVNFDYRMYDVRISRWQSMDPLFEKYPMFSPYVFVANSVLRFIDPDGRRITVPTQLFGEAEIALNDLVGEKVLAAGRRFTPQVIVSTVTGVASFASNRDTRRARRFVRRNLGSSNTADNDLAVLYDAILSNDGSNDVNVQFGTTSPEVENGTIFANDYDVANTNVTLDRQTFINITAELNSEEDRGKRRALIIEKRKTYVESIISGVKDVLFPSNGSVGNNNGGNNNGNQNNPPSAPQGSRPEVPSNIKPSKKRVLKRR